MVLLLHAQQHNKTEDVMFSCHYKIRGKTSYIECTIGRNNKHLTCNRFSNKINTIIYKTVVSIGIISSCFLIGVASLDETIGKISASACHLEKKIHESFEKMMSIDISIPLHTSHFFG